MFCDVTVRNFFKWDKVGDLFKGIQNCSLYGKMINTCMLKSLAKIIMYPNPEFHEHTGQKKLYLVNRVFTYSRGLLVAEYDFN